MSAAEAYLAALGGRTSEFRIDALDRIGVPVCATLVYDACGRQVSNGTGYGATAEEARISALGEALEGYGCRLAIEHLPSVQGSYEDLGGDAALDPVALIPDAGTIDARRRRLAWTPARRLRDGAERLVPLEWVAQEPAELPSGYRPLITPITNGLGAGDTRERALLHALLELLQRDGNSVAHRAMDRGVAVDDRGAADWLRARGIEVVVKAAECDRGIAVVHAVGCEPDGGAPEPLGVTACGEACDPDPERAIRKAVLEFCSSRVRKPFSHAPLEALDGVVPESYLSQVRTWAPPREEERALQATLDWLALSEAELRELIADPVLAVRTRIGFDELPVLESSGDVAERLRAVVHLLSAQDLDAFWIDLSPPGADAYVARVIVPGLEVETMSYRRIGRRNLERLQRRGVEWVGFGDAPRGALAVPLPDEQSAWLDPDGLDDALSGLYALYREPARHAVALLGTPA
ncbi:MAG: YcaO-like family protein [Solirubrobacterales bacterium]|nr:YcaO-like family protein [Solirubrobacterales bacterium]MBV9916393.1 YcaO-like family protein [Solirubrobacterales bacterium]